VSSPVSAFGGCTVQFEPCSTVTCCHLGGCVRLCERLDSLPRCPAHFFSACTLNLSAANVSACVFDGTQADLHWKLCAIPTAPKQLQRIKPEASMMIIASGAASSAWRASSARADSIANSSWRCTYVPSGPHTPPQCQPIRARRTRLYDSAHGHRGNEPGAVQPAEAGSGVVPIVAAIVQNGKCLKRQQRAAADRAI
jgi:hypothetical protein